MTEAEKELNRLVEKLPERIKSRIVDWPAKGSMGKSYKGKIFLKTIELAEDEKKDYCGKRITAIHIRPYKIYLTDKVVNAGGSKDPFKTDTPGVQINYDGGTGNFHKKIALEDRNIEFQVVLCAEGVGNERSCPGTPKGFRGKKWTKKDGVNILTEDFLRAVDEMEMYFPKLSEPAKPDLCSVLTDVMGRIGLNL
ncbi:hypothetical protein J6S55_00500 [Candidatus Saccharibacteria bacterium]|nr:hypothetical protein [Candidatus Saccharibacteria bacterium]